ncbi:MAG TPA: carboxymuconolactone decarboxylase family protein [Vicinamibacterales bacterium]|jgi:3-oxoadipate enol-lactonase|nr:carboxymuconolactone decarboxylase family protein [Vicinamibacterales bacterium]
MSVPDDRDAAFERGLKRRREILGDEWVDRALANRTAFNADLQSLITRFAWNEIWTRPGLPDETRRLLVLAFTIALGRWEEFDLHFRAALDHGVPADTLKEVLLQSLVYCGVPAAHTAFNRAEAIMSQQSGGTTRSGGTTL